MNPAHMDPENNKKMDKLISLSEENNTLLKKIDRSLRISRWMRVFYWVLIVGASVGAFYYFQPYIDQVMGTYSSFRDLF